MRVFQNPFRTQTGNYAGKNIAICQALNAADGDTYLTQVATWHRDTLLAAEHDGFRCRMRPGELIYPDDTANAWRSSADPSSNLSTSLTLDGASVAYSPAGAWMRCSIYGLGAGQQPVLSIPIPESERVFLLLLPYTVTNKTISAVDADTDVLTVTGHGFSTGDEVVLRGYIYSTVPGGLTKGETYYIREGADANSLTLHTSAAGAIAGTDMVDVTSETVVACYLTSAATVRRINVTITAGTGTVTVPQVDELKHFPPAVTDMMAYWVEIARDVTNSGSDPTITFTGDAANTDRFEIVGLICITDADGVDFETGVPDPASLVLHETYLFDRGFTHQLKTDGGSTFGPWAFSMFDANNTVDSPTVTIEVDGVAWAPTTQYQNDADVDVVTVETSGTWKVDGTGYSADDAYIFRKMWVGRHMTTIEEVTYNAAMVASGYKYNPSSIYGGAAREQIWQKPLRARIVGGSWYPFQAPTTFDGLEESEIIVQMQDGLLARLTCFCEVVDATGLRVFGDTPRTAAASVGANVWELRTFLYRCNSQTYTPVEGHTMRTVSTLSLGVAHDVEPLTARR